MSEGSDNKPAAACSSCDIASIAKTFGVALLAGTAVGAVVYGADAVSVATAMNGALGAAVGATIGAQLKLPVYYSLAAAIAVPVIVGGQLDGEAIAIGAGAVAGQFVKF